MSEAAETLYVGVDVGGTKIVAAGVTGEGRIVGRARERTQRDGEAAQLVTQIRGCIEQLLSSLTEGTGGQAAVPGQDAEPPKVRAIGVGVPGVVDAARGHVVLTPNIRLSDTPLRDLLQETFGVPVVLGNDVDCGTLGECWLGAGRGAHSVVGVFVGTGVGGGVVLEGRLHRGFTGAAGEIGHLVIQMDGPLCGCGNRGCLEAVASRTAIERDLRIAMAAGRRTALAEHAGRGKQIRSRALLAALEAGDELTTEVLREASRALGLGAVTIRHLLDPEVILFGGGVIEACGAFMLPLIEAEITADKLLGDLTKCRIVASALGDDAVVLGTVAACLEAIEGRLPEAVAGAAPSPALPPFPPPTEGEDAPDAGVEAADAPSYPVIRCPAFGQVLVEGRLHERDLVVRADGRAKRRRKGPARRAYGTSHSVGPDELEGVCSGEPQVLIIGTGYHGLLTLTAEGEQYLAERRIRCDLLRSPEAAQRFNDMPGRKALLLHVTC